MMIRFWISPFLPYYNNNNNKKIKIVTALYYIKDNNAILDYTLQY